MSVLLLLAVSAVAATPALGAPGCAGMVRGPVTQAASRRACPHCKQSPTPAVVAPKGRCCEVRAAPSDTPPADAQQRGVREVQGPQLALLPAPVLSPPASPWHLAALLPPPRLALAAPLPLYRPLLR